MSNMSKKIVIGSSFNNLGWSDKRLTKEWIEERLALTMNYAVPSLKKQTSQDFSAFFLFDGKSEEDMMAALSGYPALPDNIKFVNAWKLAAHIRKDLDCYDYLYAVRLDSDDMYHRTFVQQLQEYEHKEGTRLLINQNGYIYDSVQNRIAEYYHYSPQFYVIIYKSQDYFKGERYKFNGHRDAINQPHEIIEKRNYVNHVHKSNYSLGSFRLLANKKLNNMGEIITDKEKIDDILKDFL